MLKLIFGRKGNNNCLKSEINQQKNIEINQLEPAFLVFYLFK